MRRMKIAFQKAGASERLSVTVKCQKPSGDTALGATGHRVSTAIQDLLIPKKQKSDAKGAKAVVRLQQSDIKMDEANKRSRNNSGAVSRYKPQAVYGERERR